MPLQSSKTNKLTYLIYDLMTGTLLAELPFTGVTFSKRLNVVGDFSAALNFLDSGVRQSVPGALLQPGRTAVFVDYDGTLLWGGIIWTVNFSRTTAGAVPVRGKECWSYLAARVQAKDYTNPAWTVDGNGNGDPMAIANRVLRDALNVPGSAFGPSTGFPMSISQNGGSPTPGADWVNVSYPYTQLQTVDQIVTNLSEMGHNVGFDFAIDLGYDAHGQPTVAFNMGYPRRGRTAGASAITIFTDTAEDYSYPQDATSQGTTMYATGSGSGQTQVVLANPAPVAQGWPLLERVVSYSNVSSQAMLHQISAEDSVKQSYPITTPQLSIPMFGDVGINDFTVGDDIRWIIASDERFPNGLDAFWRVVALDYKVQEAGISTVLLTLNLPPGSGAQEPPT